MKKVKSTPFHVKLPGDLVDFDVLDEIGDAEDWLREDVEMWLRKKSNCSGVWRFRIHVTEDSEDGETINALSYSVDFENERDAVLFKTWWL